MYRKNLDEVAKSLYEGKSGIGIDPLRIEYGYRSPLTGIVERPVLKGILDRRTRVCLAEEAEYAYMATVEALKNAGVDLDYLENNEVGIFMGMILLLKQSLKHTLLSWRKKTPPSWGREQFFSQ